MPLTITNDSVHKANYDTESLNKIKYGSDRVWPKKELDPNDCLVFEAGSLSGMKVAYSDLLTYTRDDLDEWVSWDHLSPPVEFGGSLGPLYVRGDSRLGGGSVVQFVSTTPDVEFSVSGPVDSLYVEAQKEWDPHIYRDAFAGCTNLVDASGLSFPEEMLGGSMYARMFKGCTGLRRPPALPMQQLSEHCYESMFEGCTSLEYAPDLPSGTLRKFCYHDMFKDCTSLKRAPELNAEELVEGCYCEMFKGCTALTDGPSLTAWAVAKASYNSMFQGCVSLKDLPALSFDTVGLGGCAYMFDGCTSLTKPLDLITSPKSENAFAFMFRNCVNVTGSVVIYGSPISIMGNGAYMYMYMNTGITSASINDPGTNMAPRCYEGLFDGCKNLNAISVSLKTCPSGNWDDYMSWWCSGVALSGVFRRYADCTLPYTTATDPHEAHRPIGWTEINI